MPRRLTTVFYLSISYDLMVYLEGTRHVGDEVYWCMLFIVDIVLAEESSEVQRWTEALKV